MPRKICGFKEALKPPNALFLSIHNMSSDLSSHEYTPCVYRDYCGHFLNVIFDCAKSRETSDKWVTDGWLLVDKRLLYIKDDAVAYVVLFSYSHIGVLTL